jgi:hypothetical protein
LLENRGRSCVNHLDHEGGFATAATLAFGR